MKPPSVSSPKSKPPTPDDSTSVTPSTGYTTSTEAATLPKKFNELSLSTAFTMETRSVASFMPTTQLREKFMASEMKSTRRPSNKVDLDFDADSEIKLQNSSKKSIYFIAAALTILLIVVIAVPLSLVSRGDSDSCGSASRDKEIKRKIADALEQLYNDNPDADLDLGSLTLDCLPNDAFSEVSDEIKEIISTRAALFMYGNAIVEVKENAFKNPIFRNIEFLQISNNGISFIPDNFLKPFVNLHEVDLSVNGLVRIDNDPFSKNEFLESLLLDLTPLVELPRNLHRAANLGTLTCTDCLSLVKFSEGYFKPENFPNLHDLNLHNSAITFIMPQEEFEDFTGLDINRTNTDATQSRSATRESRRKSSLKFPHGR